MFKAVCALRGTIHGEVFFSQETETDPVEIRGEVSGLSPGLHAISINEYGDMTDGCASTGSHLNPKQTEHGGPGDSNRHAGDLGNLDADQDGTAVVNISSDAIALSGVMSIVGRSVVIYADPDDLGRGFHEYSTLTGNSGARLAGGVIGIARR